MIENIKEQAVLFGRASSLVGVLSRPANGQSSELPAIVILNTGVIHRVGHHRMYVTLARKLASMGHAVLRFDFSGIGDSACRPGDISLIDAYKRDVAEAIDLVQRSCDASQFILIGLCSGADVALRYAGRDDRIAGVVLLEPTIPPTARFYADYIKQRITRVSSWLTFALGKGRIWHDVRARLKSGLSQRKEPVLPSLIDPRSPSELEQMYASIVKSGKRLLVVLAGDAFGGRHSYREQLLDAFPNVPFGDKLQLEYFADADHVFTAPDARERLNRVITTWIESGRPACSMETASYVDERQSSKSVA